MIVECSYCQARVDAKVIAQHIDPPDDEVGLIYRVTLLSCPTCHNSLVAGQYKDPDDQDWNLPTRIWPSPEEHLSLYIPSVVRSSMEEARKCFKAGAYSACAVMCGRALEGICRHYKTKSEYLSGGLKDLLDQGVIDGRLFKWSEALRASRNVAAHVTGGTMTEDDARDLLLFATAICEYVFVLSTQFDEFMKRESERHKKS